MTVTQNEFRAALLDPKHAIPTGLTGPAGTGAEQRFAVYRNNVVMGLSDALKASFPVIAKLLGDTNFRNISGIYVREHPPKSPLMMYYGDDFGDFLEGFAPLSHLGYLGDVARLEHARRLSYHAADAAPVPAAHFATLTPEILAASRFHFAPCVQLIQSPWPILDIWNFNMRDDAPQPGALGQNVVITRPDLDPEMAVLSDSDVRFFCALRNGQTLADAVDAAQAHDPSYDATACLSVLLAGQAVSDLRPKTE